MWLCDVNTVSVGYTLHRGVPAAGEGDCRAGCVEQGTQLIHFGGGLNTLKRNVLKPKAKNPSRCFICCFYTRWSMFQHVGKLGIGVIFLK